MAIAPPTRHPTPPLCITEVQVREACAAIRLELERL